jgi:hypothetical protein
MPHVRKAREDDLKDGKIIQAEYGKIESLERNHVSSISTAHSNIGYLLTLVVNLSVLLPHQGIRLAITSLSAWLIHVSFLLCHSIVLTNIGRQGRPRHMVVHLPATPPQPKAPKRTSRPAGNKSGLRSKKSGTYPKHSSTSSHSSCSPMA